jgi:D-alanyl-D-alanine dipeptidase
MWQIPRRVLDIIEGLQSMPPWSKRLGKPSEATWTPAAKANYQILLEAMQASGFTVLDSEWWHYDSNGWQQYSISNQPVKKR